MGCSAPPENGPAARRSRRQERHREAGAQTDLAGARSTEYGQDGGMQLWAPARGKYHGRPVRLPASTHFHPAPAAPIVGCESSQGLREQQEKDRKMDDKMLQAFREQMVKLRNEIQERRRSANRSWLALSEPESELEEGVVYVEGALPGEQSRERLQGETLCSLVDEIPNLVLLVR
jgi:hypothetical protein